MSDTSPPPGWYQDPDDDGGERYWDGERWTNDRRSSPPSPQVTGSDATPDFRARQSSASSRYTDSADDPHETAVSPLDKGKAFWESLGSASRMLLIGAVLMVMGALLPWVAITDRFTDQTLMSLNGFSVLELPDPQHGMVRQGFAGGLWAGWFVVAAAGAFGWLAVKGGDARTRRVALILGSLAGLLLVLQAPLFATLESNMHHFGELPMPRAGGFIAVAGLVVAAIGFRRLPSLHDG